MRGVLLSCVFVSLHVHSPAADWPQWRGPNRDCRVGDDADWPDSLNEEQWQRFCTHGDIGQITVDDLLDI